jgi:hypothetical protein
LGLTAGALLAEGAILVPFWRTVQPAAFLAWYKQFAALLQKFFGALEVAAAAAILAAAATSWFLQTPSRAELSVSAILTIAVLAVFPLYFQRANASFAAGAIAQDRVSEELARWSAWHWVRTLIATAAFVLSLDALRKPQ